MTVSRPSQLYRTAVGVVLRRPGLALEALRFGVATARVDWVRHMPFLPLPEPRYRDWRLLTAYGRVDQPVTAAEMVDFLMWRRDLRRLQRC